jgi:vacuolar protein sorting-associated protein 11
MFCYSRTLRKRTAYDTLCSRFGTCTSSTRSPASLPFFVPSSSSTIISPILFVLPPAFVRQADRTIQVSTVALSSTLSHLALGLADGTVLLYRHLDQSLAAGGSALPKPKTMHESPTEPITGLGFREPSSDEPSAHLYLFVVTTNRVLAYQASGRGAGGNANGHVVDEGGAALKCAVMDSHAQELVLARDDAVYMCGVEGRGNCLVLEGRLSLLTVIDTC